MPSNARHDCPEPQRLEAFWLGKLAWLALEEVASHVARCPGCQERLRSLGSQPDAFVVNLRNLKRDSLALLEPDCARMEQFAQALRVEADQTRWQGRPRSDPPPTRPTAPEVLGHYRLLEKLGKGAMGAVYKATHMNLKRPVAVKLLPEEFLEHPQAVARFYREMEAIGRLDHPHIIRATDAGEAAGRHFLVMEYADGLDLGQLVQQHGPLPVADACALVRQAALGLQYAHEQGLVHRDVKPRNLLLTTLGQVKVLDLGLARLWGERPSGRELTCLGQAMGTIDYMAPEQAVDSHRVDIRADVYSLGCTLYKLLTGAVPFGEPRYVTVEEKFRAHALAPVPLLAGQRPEVPAALTPVFERMLAKKPEARFATPGEAAQALVPFCAGADLPALVQKARTGTAEAPSAHGETPEPNDNASVETNDRYPQAVGTVVRSRFLFTGLVGIFLAALAGSAVLVWRPWETRQVTAPEPTTSFPPTSSAAPPAWSEPVKPLVWNDLLVRPPRELDWPRALGDSPWHWSPSQLEVNCRKSGLLSLGKTAAPGYKLELGFSQARWEGGVGVFFGFHEARNSQGQPCKKFQMIYLLSSGSAKLPYHLERVDCTLTPLASGGFDLGKRAFTPQPIPKPLPHEQRLEVTIEPRGLTSVRWNGLTLPDLVKPELNAQFRPEDYQGDFGTHHYLSSTIIQTARFMLFERSNP